MNDSCSAGTLCPEAKYFVIPEGLFCQQPLIVHNPYHRLTRFIGFYIQSKFVFRQRHTRKLNIVLRCSHD